MLLMNASEIKPGDKNLLALAPRVKAYFGLDKQYFERNLLQLLGQIWSTNSAANELGNGSLASDIGITLNPHKFRFIIGWTTIKTNNSGIIEI